MAESTPTPQPAAPAAKPRNPVEKLLVRGFIAVMLVLVAIEGFAKWQHHHALTALTAMMKAVDEVPDSPPVTMADVKKILGNKQFRTEELEGWKNHVGANRVDIYSWFTFNPVNKREIYVYYWKKSQKAEEKDGVDNNPEVLAVQADDKAPEEPLKVAGDQPAAPPEGGGGPGMMGPGMMSPEMMGGGRGGPPPGMRGGRPPTGDADAGKSDTEKPDAEKSETEKADVEKPAQDKSADEKPKDAEAEKDQQ